MTKDTLPATFVVNTSEIRWFYPGEIPDAMQSWYDDCPGYRSTEPVRTDTYFVLDDINVGIKIRQGRVEIKQLTNRSNIFSVAGRHTAYLESWRKWSFGLASISDDILGKYDAQSNWLAITKSRSLRRYQLSSGGNLIPAELATSDVCQVELSRIQASGKVWWSLGLESTGDQNTRPILLGNVAEALLTHLQSKQLKAEFCYGYPSWLNRVNGFL